MTTVTRWNPVRELLTMREAMDRMMDDAWHTRNQVVSLLPVDAYVTNDSIVLVADVPGLKADDLQITLEGDTLALRGEFKSQAEDRKYLLRERPAGRFERIMTINTPIDHDKVEARFDNGVLTLTLPKAEAVKPRQITVKSI